MLRTNKFLWIIPLFLLGIFSCEQELSDTGFLDEEDVLYSISTYIEENREDYNLCWKIIEVSGTFDALNSYNPHGNGFTFFLPTDSAINNFIAQSLVYSSFDNLLNDSDFCMQLVRYHLVNRAIRTTEMPYGVLTDSTASGDYLTIGIEVTEDTSIYRVNNLAAITERNIELSNGFIHVVDQMLEPIIYTSYDWLLNNPDYSILASLFELTGLKDTMGLYISNSNGRIIENSYTVLAEPDSIYWKAGIEDIEDLVQYYGTPGLEPDDPENYLYQYAAYHILEGVYFLDALTGTRNYNTYAAAPVSIASGFDILINKGVKVFQSIYTSNDTIIIDYILPLYTHSNVNTKTGAIHAINQLLEVFLPGLSPVTFQFYEEPEIQKVRSTSGTYEFNDQSLYQFLKWEGPEELVYYKSTGAATGAINNDYLIITGDFSLEYIFPKVLPGKYQLILQVETTNSKNATIEVYLDGNKIGSNYNLTSGGTTTNPFKAFVVGAIEFTEYEQHSLRIESLVPGLLSWDFVKFNPI